MEWDIRQDVLLESTCSGEYADGVDGKTLNVVFMGRHVLTYYLLVLWKIICTPLSSKWVI